MEASCIVCNCSDMRACAGGCSWALVSRAAGIGVCTRCVSPAAIAEIQTCIDEKNRAAAPWN